MLQAGTSDIGFGLVITVSLNKDDGVRLIKPAKPCASALKEITSQTDYNIVNLSSKTYVFEDKLTKY